jgi:hypothetical protein
MLLSTIAQVLCIWLAAGTAAAFILAAILDRVSAMPMPEAVPVPVRANQSRASKRSDALVNS